VIAYDWFLDELLQQRSDIKERIPYFDKLVGGCFERLALGPSPGLSE
jgi:hypothetical protein